MKMGLPTKSPNSFPLNKIQQFSCQKMLNDTPYHTHHCEVLKLKSVSSLISLKNFKIPNRNQLCMDPKAYSEANKHPMILRF